MSRLQQNLAIVGKRQPDLVASVLEAGGGTLSVAPTRNGQATASAAGHHVHSAYDPWKEAQAWAEKQGAGCRSDEHVVVLGVGLLYHVEALLHRLGHERRIAVVVTDLRELHDACTARSMEGWLERIDWLWGGPDAIASVLTHSRQSIRVLRYGPAVRLHAEDYACVETALRRGAARAAGGQLHVAVVGPIYGGSLPIARYTASALETLGHRVTWLDQSLHHTSYLSAGDLKDSRLRQTMQARFVEWLAHSIQARLGEDPPDLILSLAQAPLTLPILDHLRKRRLLTAIWFVENHRLFTYWQQLAGSYDFWFVIQRGACLDNLKRAGARHVEYLPLAADPNVHKPMELSPGEFQELGADVSFVGAGYPNRRALFPQLMGPDWSFKLWGNDWKEPGPLAKVLQRNGARIDSETSVKIFNASKVNVNLHSFAGPGLDPEADFVNPRTFELAACGAFQVVDRRSLLPEIFEPVHLAVFDSADDLVSTVKRGLQDADARAAMTAAARQRVLAAHTYTHRMETLLNAIGVASPDRVGTILKGTRQAGMLAARPDVSPQVRTLLKDFPPTQRVEVQDLAARLRARGPGAAFSRDELLVLMLDEYRQEVRDFA